MAMPEARVQVPDVVLDGAPFQVKALISHPMETGLRRDETGRPIARKIINRFVCRYDGVEVFRADLHEAMAANPFLEFHLRASKSGRMEFIWEEDGGRIYALAHRLTVK